MTTTLKKKASLAADQYTPAQRAMIDLEIAKGLQDVQEGRIHGPFSPPEATRFIKAEIRARAKKPKPKR
ncbi:MAG TPA: hypothetical protein VH157_05165 [Bryobacteraceae bacterium]|nr:hypothetical protein [Bryobacteraceae bacterium]